MAQKNTADKKIAPLLDEIDVNVVIPFENASYYIKGLLGTSDVFLSFYEVINVLEIPIERRDGILYVHDKRFEEPYLFDFPENRMVIDKVESEIDTHNFIVLRPDKEYVRPEFLKKFGIIIEYLRKDISAILTTEEKSPKEVRLLREKSLKNSIKNKSAKILQLDTVYTQDKTLYRFNSIDYTIGFNNFSNQKSTSFINANSKHVVLGGSLNLGYRFQPGEEGSNFLDNLFFNWKNGYDAKFIKNLEIGELGGLGFTNFGRVSKSYGIRFSNKHAYIRRYREQEINGFISPNTPIELYAGRELVDYQYSDGNGYYSFKYTPVYAKSSISLRYIDENGNLVEQHNNLGLLPQQNDKNELTYESFFTASENNINGGFRANYGITRNITTYMGIQNITHFKNYKPKTIPYSGVYTTFFKNNLSVNAAYQHSSLFNVSFRASTNKYGNFRGEYTDFFANNVIPGQSNRGKEFFIAYQKRMTLFKRMVLSLNLQKEISKTAILRNTTIVGLKLDISKYRFSYSNVMNSSSSDNALVSELNRSQFGLDINAGRAVKINLQYFDDFKTEQSKQSILNIQYKPNSNFSMRISASCRAAFRDINVAVSLRYDLSSFLVKTDINYGSGGFSNSNALSGSYILGNKGGRSTLKSNADVGGTGALLIPFLDKNNNGFKDNDEPMVKGVRLNFEGGNQREFLENGSIYIHKMTPGIVQEVELNQDRVENIYHQLVYKTIGIRPQAGLYSTIFLPFREVGEIEGVVSFDKKIGRPSRVSIYNMENKKIATAKVESDGYFSYLGLIPGNYYLKIDVKDMDIEHTITPFELLPNSEEGAYLGGLKINFN
ncbi:MAG: hypothetical protein GKR88_16025 [Flavobacteriaceae bacterium]|nr:MAG: hypothetical protein GKR88_16025 [Flavobacteriaceae bacterium]